MDSADLDPSVSISASSPPFQRDTRPERDQPRLAPALLLSSPSGDSSPSTVGSPGQHTSPQSISLDPPPLPFLSTYRNGDSLTSSPVNRRPESSIYYTTAWGSPYAAPSSRRLSVTQSQLTGVDHQSGDNSPVQSVANYTEFRRSSATNDTLETAERELAGQNGEKSIRDFTQDWINQYLTGQPRTERSNWLSDDSGSEAPSFFTAQNTFADDASDDWLGLEDDFRNDDLLKTPTLSDFVGRKAAARAKAKKALHKRADTLRQEDFWGFAYDKDPPQNNMSDIQPTMEANSPVEKPLPPPPTDANDSPSANTEQSSPRPLKTQASEVSRSATQTPRRKKKLNWRGKACIIELPLEDKRGSDGSSYSLLTPEDVKQRMQKWEDEGYDIRGFTIGDSEDPSETTALGGLSRPLYPEPYELHEESKVQQLVVNFPDRAVWDAYVANLQEEKLRALGVSFGDPEPEPSISPDYSVNQSNTPFPGLVASPPIPTGSAASNPLGQLHTFSPFGQPSIPTPGLGSMASPLIQTPYMGVEQNMMGGYPFQFQPTPPAQGSMTPQGFINARQASSSGGPGAMGQFASMLSPVSPMHEQGSFHAGFNDKGVFDDQFGHGMHPDMHQEGLPYQTPQTPVNGHPDHFHASNVEIAHPTPRGHGHNLSETLQRGLDQMTHSDYHLEDSIDRQLEDDYRDVNHAGLNASMLKSRWALPHDQQHPQDGSRQASHSFSQHPNQFYEQYQHNGHDGSDLDTNPSVSGTPQTRGAIPNQGRWHETQPSGNSYHGHRSQLSTSSLNVEAKEFDPSASFGAQPVPFGNNAFQFGGMGQQGFGFAPPPAFEPGTSTNGPAQSEPRNNTGGFKFSAASFNVDAPVFNPSASLQSTASSDQPSPNRTKIFGDIDINEISKPSKQSKAIPIVRPDENEQEKKEGEQTHEDDIHGRPVPTDRHKRARRGVGHAEGEARYSISTHPLGETGNVQFSKTLHSVAEGKENAMPDEKNPVERRDTPASEADTWTLFDAKNEAENRSNAASPVQEKPAEEPKDILIEEREPKQPAADEAAPAKGPDHAPQGSKSSIKSTMLSPTAPPFEFKPAVSNFVPTSVKPSSFSEQKPVEEKAVEEMPLETPVKKPAAKPQGGLMASRFAASPPKKAASPVQPEADTQSTENPEIITREPKGLGFHWDSENDSPDDEELNAIMEQLNDDSDVGIERRITPAYATPAHMTPFQQRPEHITESMGGPTKEQPFGSAEARSEAPSPSPGGAPKTYKLSIPKLGSDIDANSNATFSPQKSLISRLQSPVRQLVTENDHVSDWDDMISEGEDEKFMNRNRFFDRRINDLVGSAIDDRLGPMERALAVIQQSVASIATGASSRRVFRSTSAEMEDSDADDEDDSEHETASVRDRSPHNLRERKLEMLKNVVMEALITHDIPQRVAPHSSHSEMSQLKESIAELQALTIKKLAQDPVGDMREIVEEMMAKQLAHQAQLTPRLSEAEEIGADSLMLQIDGLKSMLRLADERADQEYKDRRQAQDSMTELQRLLKYAEEDAARHSAAAEDAESRLLQFKEEKIPHFEKMQFRAESLAEETETLKVTIAELSTKNIALEGTLDEYRVSSDNFRRQLDVVKGENKSLHETIDHLRTRIEDSMVSRQNLTEKFDRLQDDMISLTADVTRDQASWRRKEEDQIAKNNELRASHARELKLREKLEEDIRELEKQERESAKLKFLYEQSQQENGRLEDLITSLRAENHDLQLKAGRFEREFSEARESSRVEIQRTRTSLEADLEASNSQVNIVRAELEAQIIRLQSQLDNNRMDTDTARERYELLLEEARDSKVTALAAKDLAIDETRKMHERVLNDLRERHARALHNSSEDRQRGEHHTNERVSLAEDKAKHFQERVQHLEEKLEIAQSAARAAAEAAHSAKASPVPSSAPTPAPSHSRATPSMSFSKGSGEPERISPQALRESIFVLQDQLQQRETRIEELEQEISTMDKDAPTKIKERDTEITWLRELLGVRIDDLQDIIKTVSQPSFNQHAVRDAAIRLKANLQMQQQEKERMTSGALPSLSDLAASPRSLPLAAAAAWGNWRKARDNATAPSDQTPSKPSNAGTFLSGLLTPPSSHVRQNAPQTSAATRFAETRPLRGFTSTPRRGSVRKDVPVPEPPKTPPLLRRSSYDHDAEPANYEEGHFDENESTVDGMVSASPKGTDDGPFGPQIAEAEDEDEEAELEGEGEGEDELSPSPAEHE